jgi:hypothetical protein
MKIDTIDYGYSLTMPAAFVPMDTNLANTKDYRQTDLHLSTLRELIPRHFHFDPESMYAWLTKMLSPRLVTHGFDQDLLLLVETGHAKCRFCNYSCLFSKVQKQLSIEYDSNREFDDQVRTSMLFC